MKIRVYDLLLDINPPLAGFPEADETGEADVTVTLDGPLPRRGLGSRVPSQFYYTSPFLDEAGTPSLLIRHQPGSHFLMQFSDGTEFLVDECAARIEGQWNDPLTLADALVYLFGAVLSFVLLLRGVTCLHGSAVVVGPRAVVIAGDQEAGKSSTTAALARRGLPVLADDVAALDDRQASFRVAPGPPRLLLLPRTVKALWASPEDLPLLTPNWDKHYLSLTGPGLRYCREPVALGAVYLLGDRKPDLDAPTFHDLSGSEGMIQLVANTYATRLQDREMRAREFELLTRLVRSVPVRRVHAPDDLSKLEGFCDGLLRDCESLGISQSVAAC
jgi:hypothetical protein